MGSLKDGWLEYGSKIVLSKSRTKCAEVHHVTHCKFCKPLKDAFHCKEWVKTEMEQYKEAVMERARSGAEALEKFRDAETTS